jgi:hypothetical protein
MANQDEEAMSTAQAAGVIYHVYVRSFQDPMATVSVIFPG